MLWIGSHPVTENPLEDYSHRLDNRRGQDTFSQRQDEDAITIVTTDIVRVIRP